tara:strand:- start:4984 stop:5607 length:624 start_codon:yes stop_codon:yes gene_type:complete
MSSRLVKIARIHQSINAPRLTKKGAEKTLFEGLTFHIKEEIPLYSNIYRYGSNSYFKMIREAREAWKDGSITFCEEDIDILTSDAGLFGEYNGKRVPLDTPFEDTYSPNIKLSSKKKKKKKDPPLGKPKRGGSKKFYVYVRCKGKIKKVSFGSPDMPLRISEPDRRRSFVARHKCKSAKDRCTPRYWSCRIGRYPNLTGAKKKYTWW